MVNKQNYQVAPGVNYEYVYIKASDPSKLTLLFLHGFPSSFYCWRHQMKFFSEKGYGCLAPNLMGYGKTYSPLDPKEYRTKSMVAHLVALLDHLELKQVVVLGHDWGTRPATRFVLYEPDRTLGLVLISVGYHPPHKFDLEQALKLSKERLGYENIGYWKFFEADDAAQLIEQHIDSFINLGYPKEPKLWRTDFAPLNKAREWISQGKTTERAEFITEEDVEVIRSLAQEGMQPKLNWYKAAIQNVDYEDEKDLTPMMKRPVLFIGGSKDAICIPKTFAGQQQCISDLQETVLESSHWIMEEKPDEVNQAIESWLEKFRRNP